MVIPRSVVTIDKTYVYVDGIILVVDIWIWINEEITSLSSISLDGVAHRLQDPVKNTMRCY